MNGSKFLFLLLAFFLFSSNLPAAEKNEIIIGFNPAENADTVETNGKAFSQYFKQKTGLAVKIFVSSDYTALIEALRSGRIDFAFMPPFSFVKAEEMANAQVLLKSVRKGKSILYSAIIVRADKPYKKIEDLKGKNIAWVDPSSTSGHIFPKAQLKTKKHIDADTFFDKQIFAGAHDALVLSVLNGTVDAGATFVNDSKGEEGAWHIFLRTPEEQKKIRMIYVTEGIPADTMATTKKFITENKALVDKVVEAMKNMHKNEKGKHILNVLYHIDSMVPAESQDYQPIRDAAKVVNIK